MSFYLNTSWLILDPQGPLLIVAHRLWIEWIRDALVCVAALFERCFLDYLCPNACLEFVELKKQLLSQVTYAPYSLVFEMHSMISRYILPRLPVSPSFS